MSFKWKVKVLRLQNKGLKWHTFVNGWQQCTICCPNEEIILNISILIPTKYKCYVNLINYTFNMTWFLITTYNPSKSEKKKMLFHDKDGIFQSLSRGTPLSSLFWRETQFFLLFTNKEKNVHYNLLLKRLVDLHGAAPSTWFDWLFNKGQIWRFGEKMYIYSE